MGSLEVNIVNAATECLLGAGVKRTNMTRVAQAAGVSRQTVYAYFPCRDDLLAAVTRSLMSQMLEKIAEGWRGSETLGDKLDVYFQVAVLEPFDILAQHPEVRELLLGVGAPAARVAAEADVQKALLLTEGLGGYADALSAQGTTPEDLAQYIARVSRELKYTCPQRDALVRHLHILKTSTLALIHQGDSLQ